MFQLLSCSWNTVPKPEFGYYHIITVTTSLIVYWYFFIEVCSLWFYMWLYRRFKGKKKLETLYKGKNPIDWNLVSVYDNFNAMCKYMRM